MCWLDQSQERNIAKGEALMHLVGHRWHRGGKTKVLAGRRQENMVEKYGKHATSQISPFSPLVKVKSGLSWPGSSIMSHVVLSARFVATKTYIGCIGIFGL